MLCTPSIILFFMGCFMKQVDLISFLRNYCGIVNENLKYNKLTHIDVSLLFPNIERMDFDELKYNQDKLYTGDIILVYDYKGYVIPYINPRFGLEYTEPLTTYVEEEEVIDINAINLDQLSKDELIKLRRRIKKNKQLKDEKIIVKAIRRKKDRRVIRYKIKKNMLRMEEF